MSNFKIIKLIDKNSPYLPKLIEWQNNWWGKRDGYIKDEVICFMENMLGDARIPQTYIAIVDDEVVGCYQFEMCDLAIRPDIYPWLANVYIDKNHRGKGYCRQLMESVKENARKTGLHELYLYTEHQGLYEKFGWTLIEKIDTFTKTPRLQSLYRLEIE